MPSQLPLSAWKFSICVIHTGVTFYNSMWEKHSEDVWAHRCSLSLAQSSISHRTAFQQPETGEHLRAAQPSAGAPLSLWKLCSQCVQQLESILSLSKGYQYSTVPVSVRQSCHFKPSATCAADYSNVNLFTPQNMQERRKERGTIL